jgi:hypothetical protein
MAKLLLANETVLLLPAVSIAGIPTIYHATTGASAPISTPTKAILDSWISRTDSSGNVIGGNISGAIRDDMKLGLTGSERSTSRALTSFGKSELLTTFNFQAQLTIFMDGDLVNPSTFKLAKDSTRIQGVPYVIAHRLGVKNTVASTVGEEWDLYFAETGQPIPGYGDGEELTIGLSFVPKNIVNIKYALGA